MKEIVYLRSGQDVLNAIPVLRRLRFDKPWRLTLERVEPKARTDQEAVLRGIEQKICRHTGQSMDSTHDELLIMKWGAREHTCRDGSVLRVPARRTRTGDNPLNESEMREHIRFVEAEAASMGAL